MTSREPSRTSGAPVVAQLPDLSMVRALVRAPWGAVEAQAGKFRHQSARNSRAWSTSALLIHGAIDVLVYVEAYDEKGAERFSLRFARSNEQWCSQHLQSARPPFKRILRWPPEIVVPPQFSIQGPTDAEVGLGAAIQATCDETENQVVPVLWCCFRAGESGLLLYADSEIPLNVGVAEASDGLSMRKSLGAVSVTKL